MQIKAKKQFGQNFLVDQEILHKIISVVNTNHDLVEIGPGMGALSEKLLQKAKLLAFEIDMEAINYLNDRFSEEIKSGKFSIRSGDVLEKFSQSSLHEKPYNLVANLPYYIATNIILLALKDTNCRTLTVMIQKEVAQKFLASSGDKNHSFLSIMVELICQKSLICHVPPSAFEPMPKVDSAVIKLDKIKNYEDIFSSKEFENFQKFLRVCFSSPRKILLKNLSSSYKKEKLENIFQSLNIALNSRPHEINTQNYTQIFKSLCSN